MMNHPGSNFIVRLRGLPYSTNQNEIRNFLQGCQIRQIHLLTKEQGRPTGECFVIMEAKDDVELAKTFDKKLMSNRYIEVFESHSHEMAQMMKISKPNEASYAPTNSDSDNFWSDPVVRLRGLPYNATKEDVMKFFAGLDIAQNGVHISSSKPAGEAFVAFMDMDNAHRALGLNRKNIGHRYIEIFKSNYGDARASILNDTQASLKQKANYDDPRSNNYPPNDPNHAPPAPPSHYGYDHRNTNQHVPSMPTQSQSQSLTSPPTYYNQYDSTSNNYSSQPPPVQTSQKRPMSTSFVIKMRGVPYDAVEKDIFEFFKPLVPIQLDQEGPGRGRPPAWYAEFGSREEATDAMTFDKQYMGSRYVELFPLYDELYPSKTMRA